MNQTSQNCIAIGIFAAFVIILLLVGFAMRAEGESPRFVILLQVAATMTIIGAICFGVISLGWFAHWICNR